MTLLITGSAGHLGEALMRTHREAGHDVLGIDIKASPFTDRVGDLRHVDFVQHCAKDTTAIMHTATLHKPHVATHTHQDFVDTNITGTLNLLEAATEHGHTAFVYTSTTSAFGGGLTPPAGEPAVWVNEALKGTPRNIYGVTKTAAEDLCALFARNRGLPCVVLRTSRFFPEDDDNRHRRAEFSADNLKVLELLYRRVDIADAVTAHQLAIARAPALRFDRFVISATTPYLPDDCAQLALDAPAVTFKRVPGYLPVFEARGWRLPGTLDRVYDNRRARERLGWQPTYTFEHALHCLDTGGDFRSPLAQAVGSKGYHDVEFDDGPFPVEDTATEELPA